MGKDIKFREYEQNVMIDFIKNLKASNPEISFVLHNGFLNFGEDFNPEKLKQFSYNFGTGKGIDYIIETNGDFELPIIDDSREDIWYDSWQNNAVSARTTSYNEKELKEKLSALDVVEFNPGLVTDSTTFRTLVVGGKAKKNQKNKSL